METISCHTSRPYKTTRQKSLITYGAILFTDKQRQKHSNLLCPR